MHRQGFTYYEENMETCGGFRKCAFSVKPQTCQTTEGGVPSPTGLTPSWVIARNTSPIFGPLARDKCFFAHNFCVIS